MAATPWGTEHHINSWGHACSITLERGFNWKSAAERDPAELDRRTARAAVRSLSVLCAGLIRPRSFEITTCWADEEYGFTTQSGPASFAWFAKTPDSSDDVTSSWKEPRTVETETLDEQSMLVVVDRALGGARTSPEGKHLVWDEIRVEYNWARLPEADRYTENDELRLDDYHYGQPGRLVRLERAHDYAWVTALHGSIDPFDLRVSKSGGMSYPLIPEVGMGIELCIDVNWTFWWRPGQGRALLDQAVDRLRLQGWGDPEAAC